MIKANFKKIAAIVMAIALAVGVLPTASLTNTQAATSATTLTNLGKLGSVTIGSHTKSGNWWKIKIDGEYGFCMDLGATLRTGDYFTYESKTYSSDSSSEKSRMYAYVGYWVQRKLDSKGYLGKKDYQMAQALFWAVSEGYTSKSELVSVIKQVISNGYSTDYTATEWYENVLIYGDDTVVTTAKYWTYVGSSSKRQRVMTFETTTIPEVPDLEPSYYTTYKNYRQRIRVHKEDDAGNAIEGATFQIEALNIDEIYSFGLSDGSGGTSDGVDEDEEEFVVTGTTSSSGNINLRMTYQLQSQRYAYLSDSELAMATSAQIKELKERLDDEGVVYGSNLTYKEAVALAASDLEEQFSDVSNNYIITELSVPDGYVLDEEYADGVTVTLTSANSWLQDLDAYPDYSGWADAAYAAETGNYQSDYTLAVKYTIVNERKKVYVDIIKKDGTIEEAIADGIIIDENGYPVSGDGTLEGAVYGLYSDESCTEDYLVGTYVTEYIDGYYHLVDEEDDEPVVGPLYVNTYYYLKEMSAPEGYLLNDGVKTYYYTGADIVGSEYETADEVSEEPITGHIAIYKYTDDRDEDSLELHPEEGAEFKVYLTSAGSYEDAEEYQKDYLITDENGYAKSKELPYGEYTVHQVSGTKDTYYIDDVQVVISEDGVTYPLYYVNKWFRAYLKVIKVDAQTGKTVLKENTQYQIYEYDEDTDTETLVTQKYSNGNKITSTSTWTTDASGVIMTYNRLPAGTYHIYEINAAEGYTKNSDYVEVVITLDSYETEYEYDDDGNVVYEYYYAEAEYLNDETYGKLGILKMGETLTGYTSEIFSLSEQLILSAYVSEGSSDFVYETDRLDNAVFEIYAAENIYTQDNQGDVWFNEGDLVCTVTSGISAEFTSECGGITGYELDTETGLITLSLPLGTYEVVETYTPYGYVIGENNTWTVEFTWESQDNEYVLNSNEETATEDGTLTVDNDLVKGNVSIIKTDSDTGAAVESTVFGLYTKDNIYNAAGGIIAEAGELLDVVVTDENGYAASGLNLPIMSEGYAISTGSDTTVGDTTESTDTGTTVGDTESIEESTDTGTTLNSGDYYFVELSVSESYYINSEPVYLHLEYADMYTAVVTASGEISDVQTVAEIDKMVLNTDEYLEGANLAVVDLDDNTIVSWTTGAEDSISINETAYDLGYRNLDVSMDDNGSITVYGLFHDTEYTLVEISPADGYVIAESITFMLSELSDGTQVLLNDDGEYTETGMETVIMYDDTTKVVISKQDATTGEELAGAELKLYDEEGNLVDEWTSTEETHYIEAVLIAGATYTLHEEIAPDGYVTASDVTFTVSTDGSVDEVVMKDEVIPTTPKTGASGVWEYILYVVLACGALYVITLFVYKHKKASKSLGRNKKNGAGKDNEE